MDNTKKLNSERVRMLNESTQKNFEDLAKVTADQIRDLNNNALKAVESKRQSSMETLKFVENQKEDPFYHLKTLNPVLGESDKEYTVKLALPEHEAKNLLVSGEGQSLKVTLARRFQEELKNPETASSTHTKSYQSVVESLAIPGPYETRKISREYIDGILTIRLPKLGAVNPGSKA
jgi:HSP20 family molecular chaperone IbpA